MGKKLFSEESPIVILLYLYNNIFFSDKMSLSTYCVVEFLELPSPDVDKFVCVPDSWIMWTDTTNSGVCVAYPNENSAKIEELSRMNQTGPDIWLTYRAAVKYCTSN